MIEKIFTIVVALVIERRHLPVVLLGVELLLQIHLEGVDVRRGLGFRV